MPIQNIVSQFEDFDIDGDEEEEVEFECGGGGYSMSEVYSVGYPNKVVNTDAIFFNKKIIKIFSEIEDAEMVITDLFTYAFMDPNDTVTFYLRSPGGHVDEGFAIYDTMQMIPNPIATVGFGSCCSMAAMLLLSGDPGMRFITKNCWVMLHQPSWGVEGKSEDIEITAEYMKGLKEQFFEIICKHTGRKLKEVREAMTNDKWFSPKEAIEWGIADDFFDPYKSMEVKNVRSNSSNKSRKWKTNGHAGRITNYDNR